MYIAKCYLAGYGEKWEIEADDEDEAMEEARELAEEWIKDGDWGDEGASIDAYLVVFDEDENRLLAEGITVEIEPNHEALIKEAGGDVNCKHKWTATVEVEGGAESNPGVWSVGGTGLVFNSHCIHCGLMKEEYYTGSQRNPGEHDTVSYRLPTDEELKLIKQ